MTKTLQLLNIKSIALFVAAVALLFSTVFTPVQVVHAETNETTVASLNAQIESLLKLIEELRAKVNSLNPNNLETIIPHNNNLETIVQPNKRCLALTRSLRFGSRDTGGTGEVAQLQQFLKEEGYYTYPEITGYYGAVTVAAVKKWQAAKGVVSNGDAYTTGYGAVGPITRAALSQCAPKNFETIVEHKPMTPIFAFDSDDVKTVKVRYVTTRKIDGTHNYYRYTITLDNGKIYRVNKYENGSMSDFEDALAKIGYDGDAEDILDLVDDDDNVCYDDGDKYVHGEYTGSLLINGERHHAPADGFGYKCDDGVWTYEGEEVILKDACYDDGKTYKEGSTLEYLTGDDGKKDYIADAVYECIDGEWEVKGDDSELSGSCYSKGQQYEEGATLSNIVREDGTLGHIADGYFQCVNGEWEVKGDTSELQFSVADIKSMTVEAVDPQPTLFDDEYAHYVIYLKNDTEREIERYGFSAPGLFESELKAIGYTGTVEAFLAFDATDITKVCEDGSDSYVQGQYVGSLTFDGKKVYVPADGPGLMCDQGNWTYEGEQIEDSSLVYDIVSCLAWGGEDLFDYTSYCKLGDKSFYEEAHTPLGVLN